MKKIIILAAIAAFNYAHAQSTERVYAINTKTLKENALASMAASSSDGSAAVNSKALKNFAKNFKEPSSAQWSDLKEQGSVCRFYEKGILHKAFYSANGSWLSTITSYEEALLPENIKAIINNSYPEYLITYVNEVSMKGYENVFIVNVESIRHLKVLKVTADGEIEVAQEGDKQISK
jgi:hypothetical protein